MEQCVRTCVRKAAHHSDTGNFEIHVFDIFFFCGLKSYNMNTAEEWRQINQALEELCYKTAVGIVAFQ